MRGFIPYVVIGILVGLAMDLIAAPVGPGLAVGAGPVIDHGFPVQSIDRTNKTDRFPAPTAVGNRQLPSRLPGVPIGCEPVFSPLSAFAHANFSGRCVS